MRLSAEEVRHIALLARLGLSEEEVEKFRNQLSNILENMVILAELDTAGLPPTSQSIAMENIYRQDEPQPSLPVEDVLANAPDREENYFKVNAVLEQ
jgi:aspartyl-tRNA(Asn)/glutamyl-tRNA(Gln) amidotransferase subunit C